MSLIENYQLGSITPDEDPGPDGIELELDDLDLSDLSLSPEDMEYLSEETVVEIEIPHFANIAEYVGDDELEYVVNKVIDGFEADRDSRSEWDETLTNGLDLLGLKFEETGTAFQGSCAATHPLIIEAAVKFQSKASQELLPANGPVRTQIIGDPDSQIVQQSNRVRKFMNYELTELMPEYFDEMERMLFHLPIVGSAIVKMYYDGGLARPTAEHIPIDQFYVSYSATDLRKAERYTHVIYKSAVDLEADIRSGMYRDLGDDLPEAADTRSDNEIAQKIDQIMGLHSGGEDPEYTLLEQHVTCQLEDDDRPYPYIITVEQDSRTVLSIRRNYLEDDPLSEKMIHFTHYRYVPGFGFYGLGLIHLIGNLTMTATSAMRALVDAGQFANLPGGFKAKGIRVVGDSDPISPGEFKEVETLGMDLSKSIVNLPYKEPSQTLFQLLGFVSSAAEKFADQTDQVVSDAASYGPVGTTMALLEASAKFFSAVHKRLHAAQRQQFKILARINYDFVPVNGYPYATPDGDMTVFQQDFDGRVDVLPVSDPNIPSRAHRISLASMALQFSAQSPPGTFNTSELIRQVLEAADFPNIDQVIPKPEQAEPADPITDIITVSKGRPIAAFPGQNHEAHIQVKTNFLQDPTAGASAAMAQFVPVIEANIREHMMLRYQTQIEGVVAQTVPPEMYAQAVQQGMQDQIIADAAAKVMTANQQIIAGGSPEQQLLANDTARLELDKAALQLDGIKESASSELDKEKVQLSAIKDAATLATKNRQLDLQEDKQRVEALRDGIKIMSDKEESEKDREERRLESLLDLLADAAKSEAGQ
jgi:hypothetical protein